MLKMRGAICAFGICLITTGVALAEDKKAGPADGFNIHVIAPHKFEDGTVHGPYHHYCKGISPEVLQCLLFESTDPNAVLTDIEYFVAKPIARELPLNVWNQFYHDHEVEIATGRVQVLDMPEDKAKEVAAAAAKTDGIIFHLWPKGARVPTGEVGHPQSVGHKHRAQ
jgi:hypothetical protein